jgi:hypothetical protein
MALWLYYPAITLEDEDYFEVLKLINAMISKMMGFLFFHNCEGTEVRSCKSKIICESAAEKRLPQIRRFEMQFRKLLSKELVVQVCDATGAL